MKFLLSMAISIVFFVSASSADYGVQPVDVADDDDDDVLSEVVPDDDDFEGLCWLKFVESF